jgi:hypothetical protein
MLKVVSGLLTNLVFTCPDIQNDKAAAQLREKSSGSLARDRAPTFTKYNVEPSSVQYHKLTTATTITSMASGANKGGFPLLNCNVKLRKAQC